MSKKISTTAPSTSATDAYVDTLPAEHRDFLRHVCDEHSARKAAQEAQTSIMRTSKAAKAAERRKVLVDAIQCCIEQRAHLLVVSSEASQVKIVLKALEWTPELFGLPSGWTSTTKTIRVVRAELAKWREGLAPS